MGHSVNFPCGCRTYSQLLPPFCAAGDPALGSVKFTYGRGTFCQPSVLLRDLLSTTVLACLTCGIYKQYGFHTTVFKPVFSFLPHTDMIRKEQDAHGSEAMSLCFPAVASFFHHYLYRCRISAYNGVYVKRQNWDVASDGKVLDKTDSIEQYTITHPNFSMSLLLISEPVGELHHIKLYSFVNKETFAT